jgi:hypothetical protein
MMPWLYLLDVKEKKKEMEVNMSQVVGSRV